jgi:hypothetical protein
MKAIINMTLCALASFLLKSTSFGEVQICLALNPSKGYALSKTVAIAQGNRVSELTALGYTLAA